ncbi:hypothetical protein HQ346_09775 [Rhodococcus sp. BP-252]|uniref:Uncharacterized protein n=1 Tax=Rhodococcoides kyotonense TaxID=398843 RepID=A0A177Y8Q1_9NOCA|nr:MULTISPECIES: hypothetical protein [Rhodococcus]MBY6411866.1 hypothetical protein [Rhodococcus sp. BP-320]MBY6416506.1 hypothetical protein [Rhodococcus sp. BP-321]MBY6420688.1 hypothetical protein [Rhodococcus sp. BP-324]MBY6426530.1 hypothetical protein [Rhodococcus sp. BP-323]MBY6431529.1 hypothetical protein [Rhodococcus sp. BP-322]
MNPDLHTAEERARAVVGVRESRSLGTLSADHAVAFARAAAVDEPRYLDPTRADFAVHPMYLLSMLRGHQGGVDDDYRPDGMFADEVPGTAGLDVRLMAGGQAIEFLAEPVVGETVDAVRNLDAVTVKGRTGSQFLLLETVKDYVSSGAGTLARVRETFIVR